MDRGWMIIGFFFIVVGIPVIFTAIKDIYKRQLRFKEKQLDVLSHEIAEKAAQYAAQIERLENRVRVLERIATDKGRDLAAEIESLRDQPLN